MNAIWRRLAERSARDKTPRWITSDIAVWAAGENRSWRRLRDAGVGSALDLRTADERGNGEELAPPGLVVRRFPIDDYEAPSVRELVEISDWVIGQIAAGSRVVIGCREGRSRSALVACATLIRLGYPAAAAYRLVRAVQPRIALSDSQVAALEQLNASSVAH